MTDNRGSAEEEYQEVDCPYFDPEWLRDHPDFPLATTVKDATSNEGGD